MCTRINCKFVHLLDREYFYIQQQVFELLTKCIFLLLFFDNRKAKKLEINEQRVAVCRDHANGFCRRQQCKYYHIPIQLPSAAEMANLNGR